MSTGGLFHVVVAATLCEEEVTETLWLSPSEVAKRGTEYHEGLGAEVKISLVDTGRVVWSSENFDENMDKIGWRK